jgi:hypothetical protein
MHHLDRPLRQQLHSQHPTMEEEVWAAVFVLRNLQGKRTGHRNLRNMELQRVQDALSIVYIRYKLPSPLP